MIVSRDVWIIDGWGGMNGSSGWKGMAVILIVVMHRGGGHEFDALRLFLHFWKT